MLDPMIQTAIALLTAHVLADFVFQTNWIVAHKRKPAVLALHGGIVFVCTAVALGGHLQLALIIAVIHFAIDAVKIYALPDTLWAYLSDQAAHLATIAVAAWLVPHAVANGYWADHLDTLLPIALFTSGLIAATLAGGPAVGGLMARFRMKEQPQSLENAGKIIGLLERTLIYLMVMIGEPTGIGFLIAAKSILRFDTVSKDRAVSEYVIIGTLASFGWALVMAFITQTAMKSL
tara:strand:+ start:99 stop:800 length:702 start_codon:yes stop_codon:yes gene_type:complete